MHVKFLHVKTRLLVLEHGGNSQFAYLPEAVVCHGANQCRHEDKEGLGIVGLLTFQVKVLSFSKECYIGGREVCCETVIFSSIKTE